MKKVPHIEADVTFLSPSAGGRRRLPLLSSTHAEYRPHLVVEDVEAEEDVQSGGTVEEEYLGVAFLAGPEPLVVDVSQRVTLLLIYYPQVDYRQLVPGATFTIREGATIVGYGQVKQGISSEATVAEIE